MGKIKWISVRVRASTHRKLCEIKKARRWFLGDVVDVLADRELAFIEAEKSPAKYSSAPAPEAHHAG